MGENKKLQRKKGKCQKNELKNDQKSVDYISISSQLLSKKLRKNVHA